ncbi:hypothetical protein RvY_09829-2 [Ramazzottius varieornatus]|uniref:Uncharacterized protein n=1 Tax=Ramazzottius varieornatus TaxID=947166 RepID=A0A1D1VAP9_RAMVA|nr:hypothetical protein RvY_09829-2 [Ramazzottius varieornatus]
MACELFNAAELHDLDEFQSGLLQFSYSDAVGEVQDVDNVLRSRLPDQTSSALLHQVGQLVLIVRHEDLFCLFGEVGFRALAVLVHMLEQNIQHSRSNALHDTTSCLAFLPFRLEHGREDWRTSNQDGAVDSLLHTIGRHQAEIAADTCSVQTAEALLQ